MKISSIFDLYCVKILLYLYQKDAQFSELLKNAVPIKSTLSYTLLELDEENLILRKVVGSRPVKVKYSLTEKGRKVAECLLNLEKIIK